MPNYTSNTNAELRSKILADINEYNESRLSYESMLERLSEDNIEQAKRSYKENSAKYADIISRITAYNNQYNDDIEIQVSPLSGSPSLTPKVANLAKQELIDKIVAYNRDVLTYNAKVLRTETEYVNYRNRYNQVLSELQQWNNNVLNERINEQPVVPATVRQPDTSHHIASKPVLKRYTYELDTTGRNPANLIKKERHTITPENRQRYNLIVPAYTPFFRKSIRIFDLNSGVELQEGIDYTCEWLVKSVQDKLEEYSPLYAAIQFIDSEITGNFEITYQTLGGGYSLNAIEIAQALANQANDPYQITYEDIIGRPLTLPPLVHVHSINDFVNFDDVCVKIEQLTDTIKLLAKEDRDSHPGYDTLIDAYFSLLEQVKNLRAESIAGGQNTRDNMESLRRELNDDLTNHANTLTTQLNNTSSDLDRRLRELTDSTNQSIDRIQAKLDGDIENFKQSTNTSLAEIRKSVANNYEDLTGKLTQTRNDLNTSLNNAKNDLTAALNAYKLQTNNTLQEHRNSIDSLGTSLGNRIHVLEDYKVSSTQRLDGVDTNVNNLKETLKRTETDLANKIKVERDRITAESARVDGLTADKNKHDQRLTILEQRTTDDTFVKTTTNQNISGDKAFKDKVLFKQGDTVKGEIRSDNDGLYIRNGSNNNVLQFKNNGDLVYKNQNVILQNDYNTLRDTVTNNNNTLTAAIDKLRQDAVLIEGAQTVIGQKTFKEAIKLSMPNNTVTSLIGHDGNKLIIKNGLTESNKRIVVDNEGKLYVNGQQVLDRGKNDGLKYIHVTTEENDLAYKGISLNYGDKYYRFEVSGTDASARKFILARNDGQGGNINFPIVAGTQEVAYNSQVVHLTGNEVIDGVKTFNSEIRSNAPSKTANKYSYFRALSDTTWEIKAQASNESVLLGNNGFLEYHGSYVRLNRSDNSYTGLAMKYSNNEYRFEMARGGNDPTTYMWKMWRQVADGTADPNIIWFRNKSGNQYVMYESTFREEAVRLTDDQTINGNKTFNNDVYIKGNAWLDSAWRTVIRSDSHDRFSTLEFRRGPFNKSENDPSIKMFRLEITSGSEGEAVNGRTNNLHSSGKFERFKLWRNDSLGAVYFPVSTGNEEVAYRSYVDKKINELRGELGNNYVRKSGDTMTGPLTINGDNGHGMSLYLSGHINAAGYYHR